MKKGEYVWLTVILVGLVIGIAGSKKAFETYQKNAAEAEKVRLLEEAEAEKVRLIEEEKQRVATLNLKLATEQVENLAASTEDVETWIKTEALDPWGTKIAIRVKGGTFHKGDVISAGPDKVFDTKDDIAKSRINYSAVNVGVGIGKSGTDLTKGIFKGVKESLFDKKKE